jgi:hypothetical protein
MSKEKKQKSDLEKKETPFYFESIGFISIIIVVIIFGRLGKIGKILTVTFMVTFGDWYWLFVLFILFYGASNILNHRNFNFRNQRFVGYMIFCTGLLVVSHFSVHKLVINRDGSYFSETWDHYRQFILSSDYSYVLGGGVVGGIIFFLIYYLLGVAGVVLVSTIIIVLGFTMIINKSIVEVINITVSKIKKIGKYTGSFNRFFKYEVGKVKAKPVIDIYMKDKLIPLKILDTYQNEMNFNFQEKQSFELKSLIISVFNNFSIEYREIDIKVSYAITTFKYYLYSNFDFNALADKLKSLIEEKVLISRYNNNLLIEVGNKFVSLLTTKNLLMKQSILNNYMQIIGINSENEIEEIDLTRDGNLLLIGNENAGIRNFIYYYICSLFIKVNIKNYEFELYDESGTFTHLDLFKRNTDSNILEYLNKLIEEIDEKTKLIKKHESLNIDEYNKTQETENQEFMKRKFIVLNYPICENNKVLEDKLMYIMQMGRICGLSVIVISREVKRISSMIISLIKIKLIFKLNDIKDSVTILNDNRGMYLDNKGEVVFINKDKQIRMQTPLISSGDIDKVIKAF